MEGILTSSNELGLLAEHFLPSTALQSGNFPQAYSHVGLINAAFAISPHWHQLL
jgi:GH15 family glucan-1,4-alpha-glucosidase